MGAKRRSDPRSYKIHLWAGSFNEEPGANPYALLGWNESEQTSGSCQSPNIAAMEGDLLTMKLLMRRLALQSMKSQMQAADTLQAFLAFQTIALKQGWEVEKLAKSDETIHLTILSFTASFDEVSAQKGYLKVMEALINTLGSLDSFAVSGSSTRREIAEGVGRAMKVDVGYARLLHDIGKPVAPSELLQKSGVLAEEECDIIKQRSLHGIRILSPVSPLLARIVMMAPERPDGIGNPFETWGAAVEGGIATEVAAAAKRIEWRLEKLLHQLESSHFVMGGPGSGTAAPSLGRTSEPARLLPPPSDYRRA